MNVALPSIQQQSIRCQEVKINSTDPRYLAIKKTMEYMFVRQNRVPSDAVQESLQHSLPACDHRSILFGLCLLRGIVTNSLL